MKDFGEMFGTYSSPDDYYVDFYFTATLARHLQIPMLVPDSEKNCWWSEEYAFGISAEVLQASRSDFGMASALLAHLTEDLIENPRWGEMRQN
jgi:hypothetical protein